MCWLAFFTGYLVHGVERDFSVLRGIVCSPTRHIVSKNFAVITFSVTEVCKSLFLNTSSI